MLKIEQSTQDTVGIQEKFDKQFYDTSQFQTSSTKSFPTYNTNYFLNTFEKTQIITTPFLSLPLIENQNILSYINQYTHIIIENIQFTITFLTTTRPQISLMLRQEKESKNYPDILIKSKLSNEPVSFNYSPNVSIPLIEHILDKPLQLIVQTQQFDILERKQQFILSYKVQHKFEKINIQSSAEFKINRDILLNDLKNHPCNKALRALPEIIRDQLKTEWKKEMQIQKKDIFFFDWFYEYFKNKTNILPQIMQLQQLLMLNKKLAIKQQFLDCKQDTNSVEEYLNKFATLQEESGTTQNEQEILSQFIIGFHPEIKHELLKYSIKNGHQAYTLALKIEKKLITQKESKIKPPSFQNIKNKNQNLKLLNSNKINSSTIEELDQENEDHLNFIPDHLQPNQSQEKSHITPKATEQSPTTPRNTKSRTSTELVEVSLNNNADQIDTDSKSQNYSSSQLLSNPYISSSLNLIPYKSLKPHPNSITYKTEQYLTALTFNLHLLKTHFHQP